jgi:enoyl-CoA hydratase/3-hydroxyacyl-CoA dehydrogenase
VSTENVAVIGSGVIGPGIAQVAAMSGQDVTLIDISDDTLRKATHRIAQSLDRLSAKEKIQEGPDTVLNRIKTTTDLRSGVSRADYVIEAVFEDINLKRKVMCEVEAFAPERAVMATNTSGLSITAIADAVKRKDRVIGMHWMNPPPIMKLVEIVRGKDTSEDILQRTFDLCKLYEKTPVMAHRDVWFFLAARARAGWAVACNVMYLEKEADFKEIDAFARYQLGLPMGEFELTDFTGALEIRCRGLASTEEIIKDYPKFEPWPAFLNAFRGLVDQLWRPMIEKGLKGLKTGRGFYTYPEGKYMKPELPKEMGKRVDPIQLLAPAINVAAWCASNGVGSIDDVNKSFKLAFGWPKGIFEFVDNLGAAAVVDTLKSKQAKAPEWLRDLYKPDPLLVSWNS